MLHQQDDVHLQLVGVQNDDHIHSDPMKIYLFIIKLNKILYFTPY